jgi:hypothetical protein
MDYEYHLTVEGANLRDWIPLCKEMGVKPVHVTLRVPEPRVQMMFTAHHRGSDRSVRDWADRCSLFVGERGFTPIRQKIEVRLDKASRYRAAYYETHEVCMWEPEMHTPGVSYSLISKKWFITTRNHGTYDDAMRVLRQGEREAVILDTNPSLDDGWL